MMAGWNDERLINSREHANETHERWRTKPELWTQRYWRLLRAPHPDDEREVAPDGWDPDMDQCGGCAFYMAVEGALGSDWGVCTNAKSKSDGRVRFEHDSCEEYTA